MFMKFNTYNVSIYAWFYKVLFIFLCFFISFNSFAEERFIIKIEKGDTFYKVFRELNISNYQSNIYIDALKRRLDLRKIPEGQEVNFYFKKNSRDLIAVAVPLLKGMTVLAWNKNDKIISDRLSEPIFLNIINAIVNGEEFKPKPGEYDFIVKKGDNFSKILTNAGVSFQDLQNIITALSPIVDLKKLRPKDSINLFYKNQNNDSYLDKVTLVMHGKIFLVQRDDFGVFRHLLAIEGSKTSNDIAINEKKVIKGDTILGQLKSVGWNNKEAREAVAAFSTVFDPKKIMVGFSVIFPKDHRVKVFAVTISSKTAVIVTKINQNKYLAKKITIESAKKTVSNLKYIPIEESLKISDEKAESNDLKENKQFSEYMDEDDLFINANLIEGRIEKGDSLISRLLASGESRKNINKALNILSKEMDPNLLRAGSSIIIALGNDTEPLKGFFIEKARNKGFLIKRDNDNYTVSKYSKNKAKAELAALVTSFPTTISSSDKVKEWTNISLIEPYKYNVKIFTFKKGDTMSHAFLNMKIAEKNILDFVSELKKVFNPKKLRAKQRIKVYVDKNDKEDIRGISIELDKIRSIEVFKKQEKYLINRYEQSTSFTFKKSYGEIESSLYLAAKNAGLPASVLMEMVRIYSFDVDFQREIKKGDGFEVLYESHNNQNGDLVRNGPIRSAVLILGGERLSLYRYEYNHGLFDYFDFEGNSVRKALMRTPLDGARITSNFGKRKHPILGYTKMHKGVDFGASRNTPVYAAGDGIVETARRNGGYGNYIRIRHNSDYKTAYAHLERFAKFIKKGRRVKQGDVIGYVGSTGRSTGPHLHYEIIFRGKQVNPLKIRMPKGLKLKDKNLESFISERDMLDKLWNDS